MSTVECFKSIGRIHTETGNIWTHLLGNFETCDVLSFPICNKINLCFSTGVVAFVGLSVYFLSRPLTEIQLMEKLVFLIFFAGAIICLGLSFTYHTLCCNENRKISLLFAK